MKARTCIGGRPHMNDTESDVERIMVSPWSYAGLPPRSEDGLLLYFWSNYSLGVWSSWSLFADGALYFVRRIEWARGRDRVRLAGEAPTTFGAESSIPEALASSLVSQARDLSSMVQLPEPPGINLDGGQGKLVLHINASELKTITWQVGRVHAKRLDSWLEDASEVLNSKLPKSSAREAQNAA